MTVESDYWGLACRVLFESGRARVHNLRNSLNAVALGVELLGDDGRAGGESRIEHIRQQIGEAANEIEALQTLILEAAQPRIQTLPEAALWAAKMAEPVAKRKAIVMTVSPDVHQLPAIAVPEGFSVAVGELLLTACLASSRGAQCLVTGQTIDPVDLTVQWSDDSTAHADRYDEVRGLMTGILGTTGRCTTDRQGAIHRMSMSFNAKD